MSAWPATHCLSRGNAGDLSPPVFVVHIARGDGAGADQAFDEEPLRAVDAGEEFA